MLHDDLQHLPARQRIRTIVGRVRRTAWILMALGYLVYVGGSVLIFAKVPDKGFAMAIQMLLFQCCLIFVFCGFMLPAVQGGTQASLDANMGTLPTFEKLDKLVTRLGEGGDLNRHALDFLSEARRIRLTLEELNGSISGPIVPPTPRPKNGQPKAPGEGDGGSRREAVPAETAKERHPDHP